MEAMHPRKKNGVLAFWLVVMAAKTARRAG
jgi:hypothetical protein